MRFGGGVWKVVVVGHSGERWCGVCQVAVVAVMARRVIGSGCDGCRSR